MGLVVLMFFFGVAGELLDGHRSVSIEGVTQLLG